MEENNEQKFKVDTENLKNETMETAKRVKESMKGTNIKEETKATKGFIMDMIKNPIDKIKEVANDNSASFFKTALFIILIWTMIVFIETGYDTISYWGFSRIFKNILEALKDILAPTIGILVYSITALILNKEKKPLTTIISTVTITKLPVIASNLVSFLLIISSGLYVITTPFTKICSIIAIVLRYFGFKHLFGNEEDKTFIKKFVIIELVYAVAYIVIRLLGIYI